MRTPALPLSKLAQQLARKESELEGLRRTFEKRLTNLRRRKEELEAGAAQLDSEIQAAVQESVPAPAEPAPAAPGAAAPEAAAPEAAGSLAEMLIRILSENGRAMTVKELSAELVARQFPTASNNLPRMVGNRVHDLLKKGLLRRSKKKKGVALRKGGAVPEVKRGRPGRKKKAAVSAPADSNGAPPASPPAGRKKKSLRSLLAELMDRSDRPLKAKELADLAIAAGYRTKSKNFIDVVWTALGSMDNVENISGEGYRLARG